MHTHIIPTALPVADASDPLFRDPVTQTQFETRFVKLVRQAHELGFEVTITQHAAQPLRMGNKVTRIEVTPHHKPVQGAKP